MEGDIALKAYHNIAVEAGQKFAAFYKYHKEICDEYVRLSKEYQTASVNESLFKGKLVQKRFPPKKRNQLF